MWTRFAGGWDIHGDQQDPAANRAFFRFIDEWKPAIRICGGDLWDFRPLRKGASQDEQRQSLSDDFNAGRLLNKLGDAVEKRRFRVKSAGGRTIPMPFYQRKG